MFNVQYHFIRAGCCCFNTHVPLFIKQYKLVPAGRWLVPGEKMVTPSPHYINTTVKLTGASPGGHLELILEKNC